ncbi:TonB-dependent receptor [Candidatus Pelagibacter ubique]|nr:TonB-dependent receptor [Candidatus Pelagibacter ubique]
MNIRLSLLLFIFQFLEYSIVQAKDIPVIVISAGKSLQSKSNVGSDVEVIDNKTIENSNEYFIGDILDNKINGMNYNQSGGYGTVSGIQLRGQPKRYTTVYIDGVKVSDSSTPSNDYYFNNLMSGSIDRVEILKGAQSSLYGSGALAGTVQLFSKKGQEGHNKDVNISTGSFNTQKVDLSFDGKNNNYDYFLGYTNFSTDGESAMNDNSEKDGYRSDNLTMNYGYNFNENVRLENYLYYNDSLLEYDSVNKTQNDIEASDDQQASYTGRLIFDNGNLKNTLSYNNTYSLRNITGNDPKNYYGYRDAVNLLSEYNFSLDNKIVFGIDNEFDAAELKDYYTDGKYSKSDEAIYSQYFDLQLRPGERTFTTFGLRRDDHTTVGDYYTGRITLAHKLDSNTKLRTNLGTSVRFPSLYTLHHGNVLTNKDIIKAETGKSIDIGVDKFFPEYNFNLSATTFFLEYKNDIKGWASNSGGIGEKYYSGGGNYALNNTNSKTESYGLELQANWKPSDKYILGFGYTRTESYDGTTCDNPDGSCIDEMNVRVPRHQLNLIGTKIFNKNLSQTLKLKYVDERRDYGNINNNFQDVILSQYIVADFVTNYKLFDTYNLNISVKNILNKGYSEAYEYKSPSRSFNFMLRRSY